MLVLVGWHHQLDGMSLGELWELVRDRDAGCAIVQWGHKELDTT